MKQCGKLLTSQKGPKLSGRNKNIYASVLSGIILFLMVFLTGTRVAAESIELLKNKGFEETTNNVPAGWKPINAGELVSVEDQHGGKLAARFITQQHEWGYCYFATEAQIPVKPGAVYRASIWARGHGEFGFLFPQYSTTFIGSIFGSPNEGKAEYQLVPEWRRYEFVCKITDPRVKFVIFGVRVFGKDTTVFFDDASFTFDPAENPGIAIDEKIPELSLRLDLQARDASMKLFVDGKEIAPGREGSIVINEGLHCLGLSASALGTKPGVRIRLPDHPETDNRWRVNAKDETGWAETKFDDKKWPAITQDSDGFSWSTNASATNVFFRQIILWNSSHNGPNACVNPPIKEWGFSEDSVESLFLALYSPLPYNLDDYEFVLDVPKCFRLLEKTEYLTRHIMNQKCLKVLVEDTRHQDQAYTRYRMFYEPNDVTPQQARCSVIPLHLSKYSPEYACAANRAKAWWLRILYPRDDNSCRFYYRRMARGNFTELEQTIPVRILPPINGRMPKNVMISQYCAVPWCVSRLAPDHLEMHIRQSMRAGFNYWILGWQPGWGKEWRDYTTFIHDKVIAGGGHIILWPPGNFPLYGSKCSGHVSDDLFKWIEATPGARARYFADDPPWNSPKPYGDMYCPSFITGEGAAKFREIVLEAYKKMLAALPGASIIWNDWESPVWLAVDGKGSWCFCDRCKQEFRKFAGLPDSADLSDQAILKDHRVKWEEYRGMLDGKIQGELRQVSRELGKPYMLYSWYYEGPLWPAYKDKIDLAFAGVPGNAVADSFYQKHLDNTMKYLRDKVGLARVMGQRFSFFSFSFFDAAKQVSPKFQVMSNDGYVHPKSWKSQILRVTASFHGGVDLQSSLECVGGMQYYIGEATRIIAEYEPLFWEGERADNLAESDQIKYPNLLVLKKDKERLILMFNEGAEPLSVVLRNKDLQADQAAEVYGTGRKMGNPSEIKLTIPPDDVTVVHIK